MKFRQTLVAAALVLACGQSFAQRTSTTFAALESWRRAVLTGDSAALWDLYSSQPPAQLQTASGSQPATQEIEFWQSQKAAGLTHLELEIGKDEPQENLREVTFQAEMGMKAAPGKRTVYLVIAHLWQKQGAQWRIIATTRGDVSRLKRPLKGDPNLYPSGADAKSEIKQALARAAKSNKRVLVVFGAAWCYDCYVLDAAFHSADVQPTLDAGFEVVHVDIGKGEKNTDLGAKYKIPFEKGIPAIAVLDGGGKLLYSQRGGEFQSARTLTPEEIEQFLSEWKPASAGSKPTVHN